VVFSHNSKLIPSTLTDGTVKTWDATSGHYLQTLKGHNGSVNSVAFLYNSKLIASALTDVTVKIWDAASSHYLQTVNARGITRVKSFCRTNSYIELDRGTMRLSLVSLTIPTEHSSEAPAFLGCGISSDHAWITWDTANLLWLPHEYRPYTIDTTVSAISIGCKTGRVLVFKIDPR
jgi:WD40 repeat protein